MLLLVTESLKLTVTTVTLVTVIVNVQNFTFCNNALP